MRVLALDKRDNATALTLGYGGRDFGLTLPFADDASVENALQCITFMLYLGYDGVEIARRVARLEPVAMRLEVKEGIRDCVVINDSYNSDINSLDIALDFMNRQATSKQLARTLILSDIEQSGFPPAELYARVAGLVRSRGVTRLVGGGERGEPPCRPL